MFLDQRGLKNQGLFLGAGDQGVHGMDMGKHDRGFILRRFGDSGVGGEPFPQILGLAHIENTRLGIEHEINTRRVGGGGESREGTWWLPVFRSLRKQGNFGKMKRQQGDS